MSSNNSAAGRPRRPYRRLRLVLTAVFISILVLKDCLIYSKVAKRCCESSDLLCRPPCDFTEFNRIGPPDDSTGVCGADGWIRARNGWTITRIGPILDRQPAISASRQARMSKGCAACCGGPPTSSAYPTDCAKMIFWFGCKFNVLASAALSMLARTTVASPSETAIEINVLRYESHIGSGVHLRFGGSRATGPGKVRNLTRFTAASLTNDCVPVAARKSPANVGLSALALAS